MKRSDGQYGEGEKRGEGEGEEKTGEGAKIRVGVIGCGRMEE
jgi:hypothetical protein